VDSKIIFFDGECILCNGFVDFLIKKDKKNQLKYASLQGKTAQELLSKDIVAGKTVVFYTNRKLKIKWAAISSIASNLPFPYNLFSISILLPNFIYDIIANNRYKWFGKKQICRIPTQKDRGKILP